MISKRPGSTFLLWLCGFLWCLQAAVPAAGQNQPSHLRLSLLTCGVGDELYASFGHAGLRIVDSAAGTDVVYNYGTFNGFEENFELKFMRGKLLYYLAEERFQDFLPTYITEGRSVWEQELLLTPAQKEQIRAFLEENLLPQNRAYKYDFLYDNCATRVAAILPNALGSAYRPGPVLSPDTPLTFRQTIDHYLAAKHWERYGIDLLLGRLIDLQMNDRTALYLPDYLRRSVAGATLNGRPVAGPPVLILPGATAPSIPGPNAPFWLNAGMLVLVALAWSSRKLQPIAVGLTRMLLFITGLLGCLILVMWLGTDHEACRQNWNFLWAFPPNLFVAGMPFRKLRQYAVVATVFLLAAVGVHLIGFQSLPLRESGPLFVALLVCYGMIYRRFNRQVS